MLNSWHTIKPYMPTIFVTLLLILAVYASYKLTKIQKILNKVVINTTSQELYKEIYPVVSVSNHQIVLKETLQIAYQEYRHQNTILQSKISFFYTLQAIFGGLFTFVYTTVDMNFYLFQCLPIIFGFASWLLYKNLKNTTSIIDNIRLYIFRAEQLTNQPLIYFFENGIYKQNFDNDKNIVSLFMPLISIAWFCVGIYCLFFMNQTNTTIINNCYNLISN